MGMRPFAPASLITTEDWKPRKCPLVKEQTNHCGHALARRTRGSSGPAPGAVTAHVHPQENAEQRGKTCGGRGPRGPDEGVQRQGQDCLRRCEMESRMPKWT